MSEPTVQPVVTSLRWARWAVLSGSVTLAVVLSVTAWLNYRGVDRATRELADGEAVLVAQQLLDEARELGRRPTAEDLATWLDRHRDRGVRYVAIGGPGRFITAGEPATPDTELAPGRGPRAVRVGDRVRVTLSPPGPPRRRPKGPRGLGPRPPRRGMPGAVLEMVPVRLQALMTRARRGLGINVGVGAALIVAGFLAFRFLQKREAREVARARDKHLARLGEMSAVLAHEIRNPLASLKGHAQLLAEASPADSRERAKIERIVDDAVRIERLSNELLDLVRTGKLDRQDCDPVDLARASAGDVDGRIEVIDAGAPARWSLDPHRMRQVLTNLLTNAVEASPDGDAVDLTVSAPGEQLCFEVRDRGPGIAEEARDKVFEPFHTTRTRGTGLGLAVARRIVELHGGTLEAGNHPDGGAVLTATLPRGEA